MRPVVCGFMLILLAADAATKPTGQTFADSKGQFTVTVPETWKQGKLRGREGLLVMGPPPAGTRAYPMFQAQRGLREDAADRPIDQRVKELVEQITKRPVEETKVAEVELDGVDARQFKVTMLVDDKEIDFDYVIAIYDKQLFVLNFMQEKAHYDADAAKRAIGSFRWAKAKE